MATEKVMETAGEITDVKAFASAIKRTLEREYPDSDVEIHEVPKNNSKMWTGIVIRGKGRNIAPTVYLEELFKMYRNGKPLDEICRTIQRIHTETNPAGNFDVSSITDFAAVKGKICFKLVNAGRNAAMLREVPHRLWQDLAVVYYVVISKESAGGVSSLAVKNDIMGLWGVDEPALYELARQNMPALFGAEITPISDVIDAMLREMKECGQIAALPDMEEPENLPPLYVATNECKCHGAAVLLYDGVLEGFAERCGSDFYILPSSVHETLFLPVLPGKDGYMLSELVRGINTEKVAPEEVLSDNVYIYCAGDGSVTQIG
jgi:hypothetical protein